MRAYRKIPTPTREKAGPPLCSGCGDLILDPQCLKSEQPIDGYLHGYLHIACGNTAGVQILS